MKKRFIAAILTAALALGTLTACGGSDEGTTAPAQEDAPASEAESSEEAAPPEEDAAAQESEASADDAKEPAGEEAAESKGTITIAASATPHAEILEQAAPLLAAQGWTLEVTVFNDYVQPNMVVESGEFDANYFQHIPYLDSFNEEQGTHLVNAGGIHYEPFGIYPGTKSDLTTLEKGDVVAVPNDTTNEARALLLLQDNGIITLKDGVGLEATVRDIVDNPNEIEIQELEAAQVPRVKDEVAFVVLNGNYAMEAGFSVAKDAVAYEQADSEAAKTYVNVIAVKEGNESNEAVKALVDALKSDEITEYINNTYDGGVIPFK
ncbi:MAG: MetQ/NlpA family ABC transporter substrate-binding protein [Lachnospiraceae bacterium]|nr:MetQ/NlpA family ABC transporter substrate-binding protein [Lachnospiraceae bacterium]